MITRAKIQIRKPDTKLSLTAVKNVLQEIEPATYRQALLDEKWRYAMTEEYNSQIREHTWDLVPTDLVKNLVGCRWVFRIKQLPTSDVERHKTRLVAKGFHQRSGIDYFETFSPVIKGASILLVLSIATSRNWILRQLDVNHAFLQGPLIEVVFMEQPHGFIDKDKPDYVCKLNKTIYGLKQVPRVWYNALRRLLLQSGFVNALADPSLFVLQAGGTVLFVLVYVDDIVITGNFPTQVQRFIDLLGAQFSLKDLGLLGYFLSVEVSRTTSGLKLT